MAKLNYTTTKINDLLAVTDSLSAWAKATEKPTYTAAEISGALTNININNSQDISNVGTPSVTAVTADGVTKLTFHNLKGATGEKGNTGAQGPVGPAGKDGKDGTTPIKGTDYFTEADKQEIIDAVLAALPSAEGGSF